MVLRAGGVAVAQMRYGFGGHPFRPKEGVAHERREGRVDDEFRPPGDDARA